MDYLRLIGRTGVGTAVHKRAVENLGLITALMSSREVGRPRGAGFPKAAMHTGTNHNILWSPVTGRVAGHPPGCINFLTRFAPAA